MEEHERRTDWAMFRAHLGTQNIVVESDDLLAKARKILDGVADVRWDRALEAVNLRFIMCDISMIQAVTAVDFYFLMQSEDAERALLSRVRTMAYSIADMEIEERRQVA